MPFQHSIAGGQGTLITSALKSPNYVSGSTGWTVNKDGSVEFNNGTFRGTVTASTFMGTDFEINADGIFFYSGTPASGNLIASIARASGTDSFGNAYNEGIGLYRATVPGTAGASLNLTTGASIETIPAQVQSWIENSGASNEFMVLSLTGAASNYNNEYAGITLSSASKDGTYNAGGILGWFATPNTETEIAYWQNDGFHVITTLWGNAGTLTVGDSISLASGKTISVDSWHSVVPDTGWSVVSGYSDMKYRLLPDGNLQLAGARSHASITGTTAINSSNPLPTAYRPASTKLYRAYDVIGSRCAIELQPSGVLYALGSSTYPGGYAEIDGIVSLL